MSADIKLRRAKISKKQSGGSFGFWFTNLSKKPQENVAIPLARNNIPGLVGNLASNAINNFGRKIVKKELVRHIHSFGYIFCHQKRQ